MSWDAIGSIGAAVGALAVVVSLFYLARQISQNTKATRASISHAAVSAARNLNQSFMENPSLAEVYVKGWEGPHEMDDAQTAQFLHVAFNMFKLAEDLHYQYMNKTLDGAVWKGWSKLFEAYLTSPGGQIYWEFRRDIFSRTFQDYRDSLDFQSTPTIPRHEDLIKALRNTQSEEVDEKVA